MKHTITAVEPDSIAEELAIRPGDVLVEINGASITDVFDYRFAIQDEFLEILIEQSNGTQILHEIEKDDFEDLGLVFASGLMGHEKRCANKCIFCFIDQLPKNMRPTLYFKDDDARLSFLSGNYVTLTNIGEKELTRLIFYHLSPINISVHATDPDLRCLMLNNKHAGNLSAMLDRFAEAGITMNFQIVLCKGINDGVYLEKSIADLSRYLPYGQSLSVVPAGLSRHRDDLFSLQPFTKADCSHIIKTLHQWQKKLKAEYGTRFVFVADEFYLGAEEPIPPYAHYEDFPQIENGVGMMALFARELDEALEAAENLPYLANKTIAVVTGLAAANFMREQAAKIMRRYPGLCVNIYPIRNDFFGENITVSGLLTGADILTQLAGQPLGEKLFVPQNALRSGETCFLDDMTLENLGEQLGVRLCAAATDGGAFLEAVCRLADEGECDANHSM